MKSEKITKLDKNLLINNTISFLPHLNSEALAHAAFPSRDELIIASSLVTQIGLTTETPEGLEEAHTVFQAEIVARKLYGETEFAQQRISDLAMDYNVNALALLRLQNEASTDSSRITTQAARLNTYVIALKPEDGIGMIEAELRRRSGSDFSDTIVF